MFGGMMRVVTVVIFGLGAFIYAPAIYTDDEAPNWLVPAGMQPPYPNVGKIR